MTNNPLESHNCRLCVAPKTESSKSSSGNTRSNCLSEPWLSDSFTRHGDRIKPLVPTILSKQDWCASFFRLTSWSQVTVVQSDDCQCTLRGWLPDVTVTHCTSGYTSRTPQSVRLMKEEANVPISPSQKVLQGPPGDALQVSQPPPPQFLHQHCC